MTTPAWVPPQIPEVPAPDPDGENPGRSSKRRFVVALTGAAALVFVVAGAAWRYRPAPTPDSPLTGATEVADQLLEDMVSDNWDGAYAAFDTGCVDFDQGTFRVGFDPVLDPYRAHELAEVRRPEVAPGDIVLVRGLMDRGGPQQNPVRVELVYAGPDARRPWDVCGLRIDEP